MFLTWPASSAPTSCPMRVRPACTSRMVSRSSFWRRSFRRYPCAPGVVGDATAQRAIGRLGENHRRQRKREKTEDKRRKVPVRRLRNRVRRSVECAVLHSPRGVGVLRNRKRRIEWRGAVVGCLSRDGENRRECEAVKEKSEGRFIPLDQVEGQRLCRQIISRQGQQIRASSQGSGVGMCRLAQLCVVHAHMPQSSFRSVIF